MTDQLAHATARHAQRSAVLNCAACPLGGGYFGNPPVPFTGPSPARVLVLGETPDIGETEGGLAWSSPAAFAFRKVAREVGLDPLAFAYGYVVCCYKATGTKTNERDVCTSHHLRPLLSVVEPEWILAAGEAALRGVWPRARLSVGRGRWFEAGAGPAMGRRVFTTASPWNLTRSNLSGGYRTQMQVDLHTFRTLLDGTHTDPDVLKVRATGRGLKL